MSHRWEHICPAPGCTCAPVINELVSQVKTLEDKVEGLMGRVAGLEERLPLTMRDAVFVFENGMGIPGQVPEMTDGNLPRQVSRDLEGLGPEAFDLVSVRSDGKALYRLCWQVAEEL